MMGALGGSLRRLFAGSVRRQLVFGVAAVHAVMMSLFVWDLSLRQRDFLLERQAEQAQSMVQTLALSAASGLLARDVSGLQELVNSQSSSPEVVSDKGQLPGAGKQPRLLSHSRVLADAVLPILVNGRLVGWSRVGLSQGKTAAKLDAVTRDGLLYTGAAILIGALLALWMGSRLTARLYVIRRVADAVRAGDSAVRVPPLGDDEAGRLGQDFNVMLDALAARDAQRQELERTLYAEKELAEVTLASIGDAVITTDAQGRITFLNPVASALIGWNVQEVAGKPLADIFHIIHESTREAVDNPVHQVLREGHTVTLSNHAVLIGRDGVEFNIEDSAAPIFQADGELLGCVLVFHDVTEKHRLLQSVSWQAGHDVLTGLPNRALLSDRFERALASAQRQQRLLGVCLLDLDGFKPVNDLYGHIVGDRLLVEVAARLCGVMRAEDTVARMGGDEFVLLLGNLETIKEAECVLGRVQGAIAEPYRIDDRDIQIFASIGVAVFPQDEVDADELLRHADQAMYQAKQNGRNCVHFFDVRQDLHAKNTNQTLARVSQALQQGELGLYYQPKVHMPSGEVVGLEALLRWFHPQKGMVPPLDFLGLVEQTDLIVDIGEWVLEQALVQLAEWGRQGHYWPVSVNIAARHFQRPDFIERLKAILAHHPGVSPRLLELEILESVALGDMGHVSSLITACQALGLSVALDDFGTGYSSLSYLKRLPADTLKIDQSFVRDILEDKDDLALVKAVIGLATVFKRKLIAEGVETPEQGVLLMELGCDHAQGYGIARPMPAARVADWVGRFQSYPQWRQLGLSREFPPG